MAHVLDDVLQITRDTRGKVQSLIVFHKELAARLEASKQDPEKIHEIAEELQALNQEVSDAIDANPQ